MERDYLQSLMEEAVDLYPGADYILISDCSWKNNGKEGEREGKMDFVAYGDTTKVREKP
jgi:hypothetical protein